MKSRLEITTLGGLSIKINGEPLAGLASRKAEALLVYLVCAGKPQSREYLGEFLWQERSQSRSLSNLRVILTSLRKNLEGFLLITRDSIAFNQEADLWLDVAEMESSFKTGEWEQGIALYEGEFLQGLYIRNAGLFEAWMLEERARYHISATNALHKLLDLLEGKYLWDDGILHLRKLLMIEPLDESAHRKMMLFLAGNDQRSAALAHYENCRKLLKEELGIEPELETNELYNQIKSESLELTAPPPTTTSKIEITSAIPAFLGEDAEKVSFPKPPFVARERELDTLFAALEQAQDGEGSVIFITGGPGRGKTALLSEFARRASDAYPNLLVVGGGCNAYSGIGDPFLPFREIMDMLTGDLEGHWKAGTLGRDQAIRIWKCVPLTIDTLVKQAPDLIHAFVGYQALKSRAQTALSEANPVLRNLLAMDGKKSADLERIEQRQIFQQYANLLYHLSQVRPLLLLLDDLQWADTGSISLLFHLGRRLRGKTILLACAYRPEEVASGRAGESHPLEKVLSEFKRQYGNVWIDLSQSQKTEAQNFVNAYLDTEPNRLGDDFREALLQHTNGHPLFTVELLRTMQEQGNLIQEKGTWVEGSALDWGMLPARIEGVIEQRISRLNAEQLGILQVACVEGEEFSAQVIAQIIGLEQLRVLHILSQELVRHHHLVSEGGLFQIGSNHISRYRFVHTLFHNYLYNNLDARERMLLHGQIGLILEALYKDQIEEIAVPLARHFQEAGKPELALPYIIQAGDRARTLYANAEAEMYYKQAVRILSKRGSTEETARTFLKLGLVYTAANETLMAKEAYNKAFDLWIPLRESSDLPDRQVPTALLRFAMEEPRTLDPGNAEDDISAFIVAQLFQGLVRIGRDYNVLPALATRWDVSEDGKKYTFHIKQGMLWNDGTPLTANDFEFGWRRNLAPEVDSPSASLLFAIKNAREFHEGNLDDPAQLGIRAVDDLTLDVYLESPTPFLPYLLALPITFPLPGWALARYGNEWTQTNNIVTNGPYELIEWMQGEKLTLVKNPLFHEAFSGNVQRVECRIFDPLNQALAVYDAGSVDAVSLFNADLDTLAQAMNTHLDEIITIPRPSTLFLSFRTDLSPFDDLRVRLAFVHAVNRKALAEEACQGLRIAATGGFVPPGMAGHSADIGLDYNPELASRLLGEAGYPHGQGFPEVAFLQPTASREERIVPFLRASWKRNLGLDLVSTSLAWGDFHQRFTTNPAHLTIFGWSADYPDPDNLLRVIFHSKQGLNIPRWHNARFDILVENALRINDHTSRMEIYHQADRILVTEQAAVMPLGYGSGRMLVKPYVKLPRTLSIQMPFNRFVLEDYGE